MPQDCYHSFEQLSLERQEGHDFAMRAVPRASPYAVVALHGGKIEPGTSELAMAIAGEEHALYVFEGLKAGSWALHIPSEAFDEPIGLEIARAADTVLTIHGMEGVSQEVHIGGLDESLRLRLEAELTAAGFVARQTHDARIAGTHASNLCNQGRSGRGCQLEISRGLRADMFRDLSSGGRGAPTEEFHEFVRAVRRTLGHTDPAGDSALAPLR